MPRVDLPLWGFVLIIIGVWAVSFWGPAMFKKMKKNVSDEEVKEAEAVIEKAQRMAA